MVLHHVAQGTGLIVVRAAAFHAERFGDGDLHVIDIFLVPERLENLVRKSQGQNVLDRLLAEVMVDAEYLPFIEHSGENGVQLLRAGQIASKRFFDNDALPGVVVLNKLRRAQLFKDSFKFRGRSRQIEETITGSAALGVQLLQKLTESLVSLGVAELRLMVKNPLRQ